MSQTIIYSQEFRMGVFKVIEKLVKSNIVYYYTEKQKYGIKNKQGSEDIMQIYFRRSSSKKQEAIVSVPNAPYDISFEGEEADKIKTLVYNATEKNVEKDRILLEKNILDKLNAEVKEKYFI